MNIEYAKTPVWVSADNTSIDLIVKFEKFSTELNFTATIHDSEDHGRELFNRAVSGEFGDIAPFVPPPEEPENTLIEENLEDIIKSLSE
jgi:hypothetical protein